MYALWITLEVCSEAHSTFGATVPTAVRATAHGFVYCRPDDDCFVYFSAVPLIRLHALACPVCGRGNELRHVHAVVVDQNHIHVHDDRFIQSGFHSTNTGSVTSSGG